MNWRDEALVLTLREIVSQWLRRGHLGGIWPITIAEAADLIERQSVTIEALYWYHHVTDNCWLGADHPDIRL